MMGFNVCGGASALIIIIWLCSAANSDVFPDISCHLDTAEGRARFGACNTFCTSEMFTPSPEDDCYKKCMLEELNLLEYDVTENLSDGYDDSTESTKPPFESQTIYDFRSVKSDAQHPHHRLFDCIGGKRAQKYGDKIITDCNRTLYEIANIKKLPIENWGPIYECVNNVFGCSNN